MEIINKIKYHVYSYYRQRIVCDHFPLLSLISRIEWKRKGALGIVYMLHHIEEKDKMRIPTNEDLKVSPSFIEDLILKYKKVGVNFISLDELSDILLSKQKPDHPFIAFTLDDGYIDNYTNAFPIFEKYNIPFTIFVATDFIDQKAILWWDALEDLILHNNEIKTEDCLYPCNGFHEKWDTFRILREHILKIDQKQLEKSLNRMFSNYNIDWLKPIREKAMTWDQIKELSHHPLCTIGGHTVSHPALNKLSNNDFCLEIKKGIERIEFETGQKVYHFAYPYGSPNEISEREYQLIKQFHFKTAFVSYGGCITEENKSTTHLPRFYVHQE